MLILIAWGLQIPTSERDKRPPMLCRPYGAKVSGVTFFTGAYAPRLCSVALKG